MTDRPAVLHVFSTFAVGGPQRRFATIVNRLGRKYRHLIVSMSGKIEAAGLLSSGVAFELVPLDPPPNGLLANVLRFRKMLGELRPDLLVTYNWGALEWALSNEIGPGWPHIHIEDGFGPDEAAKRFRRRIWLRRLALARTRTIVVPSRNLQRIAAREWKFPDRKVVYLPNGVDIVRFSASPPAADRAFMKEEGEQVIGNCAALRPEKNLGRLIRAFAAADVPNTRLVICGEGAERPALDAEAQKAGVSARVTFTGHLEHPENAVPAFDIFAMSSDTEQMPLGLLEAMAAGLPAVSTDVGDIRTIVAEPNRPFIVPVSDEPALAAALRALLRDPERRSALGAANLAKARAEFSLDTMVSAYDQLFQNRGLRP
jgi:glycosyltransferase involved in cell wall biosynthesis